MVRRDTKDIRTESSNLRATSRPHQSGNSLESRTYLLYIGEPRAEEETDSGQRSDDLLPVNDFPIECINTAETPSRDVSEKNWHVCNPLLPFSIKGSQNPVPGSRGQLTHQFRGER